jgi:uncharacterized protein involved in exopolysaccharide biosynthesis
VQPLLPAPAGSAVAAPSAASDTVDVTDVVRTVRRQWRAVLWCLGLGMLAAAGVILVVPPRFEGKASVLARPGAQNSASISGRITGLGDLLGNLGGLGASGSLETELQMLRSRALAGRLVDSLQLQFRVREPRVPALTLVATSDLPGSFKARTYTFERQSNGTYSTQRDGKTYQLTPGQPGSLDVGSVTLRAGSLPTRFRLTVMDREDAIDRFGKMLNATKAGGEVAKIVYRGDDSLTAAAAANSLVKFYLERRKTTDRGVNERRVEYISAQLDSTGAALTKAEHDLRLQQEGSRVFDAEIVGKVELETAGELRQSLTLLQVEEGSIKQLLAQADAGTLSSRDLAGYPAFMKSTSTNPLVGQLSELEAQRIRLLERRTERDPEVQAIDETMRKVSANILGTARSYASAITRQRQEAQSRLDSIQVALLALPAAAEKGGRLQRDVKRLTAIYAALEAQLVEARLGVIGEGGEVKQIDVAVPQRKPAFPDPLLTMGIGTGGGLLAGLFAALLLGWFGRWLRDPIEIERAVGVSAQRFEPNAPLLLAGAANARSVLVVPLDARALAAAGTVAERLARTARQRSLQASVLDLSAGHIAGAGSGNGKTADASAIEVALDTTLDQLEHQHGVTIVHLPDLSSDVTLAALRDTRPVILVAPPGPVDRTRLAHAVDTLRRMQVPCAGVVISDAPNGRGRARSLV